MRGRRWGAGGLAAVLVAAGCLVAGCAVTGGATVRVSANSVDGVRTDPDQQGLVVSYTGGACDGPAHLDVKETATRIDADVMYRESGGSCTAQGVFRAESARLDRPVGTRTIWSGGRQQLPFDGAWLLTPSSLPPGFAGVRERGSGDLRTSGSHGPHTTTSWTTTRFDPDGNPRRGPCRPTRGALQVQLGSGSPRWAPDDKVGSATVGGRKATVYRIGTAKRPRAWVLSWTVDGRRVVVQSEGQCTGDQILDRAELLQVARSLHPS